MIATLTPTVGFMGRKATHAEDTASIKISRALYRDIKSLAGFCDEDAGPWLSKFLEPLIADEMAKMAIVIQSRTEHERGRRQRG